jgi:hypothetical protein
MKPEDMIPDLAERFVGDVVMMLGELWSHRVTSTNIRFLKLMPEVNGIMFELDVAFDSLLCNDLIRVAELMDNFCVSDTSDTFNLDGYEFMIGDGDDCAAVRFENGKFTIWLRGWRHEPLEQAGL